MTSKTVAVALGAVAAAALALAGCGRQGELARPRPLVGPPTQPTASQRTRDQAAMRAARDTQGVAEPQAPQSAQEVRGLGLDTDQPPPNAYENPVPGAPQGPDQPPPFTRGTPDPLRPSTQPE